MSSASRSRLSRLFENSTPLGLKGLSPPSRLLVPRGNPIQLLASLAPPEASEEGPPPAAAERKEPPVELEPADPPTPMLADDGTVTREIGGAGAPKEGRDCKELRVEELSE